jgi:hypothetical protein
MADRDDPNLSAGPSEAKLTPPMAAQPLRGRLKFGGFRGRRSGGRLLFCPVPVVAPAEPVAAAVGQAGSRLALDYRALGRNGGDPGRLGQEQ